MIFLPDVQRFSKWRLTQSTGWMLRFTTNLRRKSQKHTGELTVEEIIKVPLFPSFHEGNNGVRIRKENREEF